VGEPFSAKLVTPPKDSKKSRPNVGSIPPPPCGLWILNFAQLVQGSNEIFSLITLVRAFHLYVILQLVYPLVDRIRAR
jgi:hypothetical protein